jgi:hypothetical protein
MWNGLVVDYFKVLHQNYFIQTEKNHENIKFSKLETYKYLLPLH